MKRQKKYTTREMILKDIDKAIKKSLRLQARQEKLEAEIQFFKACGANTEKSSLEIERLRGCIERLRNTRLRKLQNTLAAFDTAPLIGDRQVVLQGV